MRPIDADALKETIDNIWDGRPISLLGARILATIDHAPTIDPKAKVIAQITFDEDKLREIVHEEVERIKEEYDITDGWILCSERLPSEDEHYLVCMNWEYDYMMEVLKWANGWNCYRCYDGKIGRENEIDEADVIAWMPLPKPYREDGEV